MVKKKTKIKRVTDKKELRFHRLALEIICHKFLYYEGAKYDIKGGKTLRDKCVADEGYDKVEDEYRKLAKKLKMKPSAADMVGFDSSRPSCKLLMGHLIANRGRFPGTVSGIRHEVKEFKNTLTVYMSTLKDILEEVGVKEKTAKKIRVRMKKRLKDYD